MLIYDENDQLVNLPMKWEICTTCQGHGKHSLAVDGHGITQEEFDRDWSDEMKEHYFAGGYDSTCSDCKGAGKVLVIDKDRCDPEVRRQVEKYESDMREVDEMWDLVRHTMERRYGC